MTRSSMKISPRGSFSSPAGERGRAKPARAHASYWPALAFVALGTALWQCGSAGSGNGVMGAAAKGGASGSGGVSTFSQRRGLGWKQPAPARQRAARTREARAALWPRPAAWPAAGRSHAVGRPPAAPPRRAGCQPKAARRRNRRHNLGEGPQERAEAAPAQVAAWLAARQAWAGPRQGTRQRVAREAVAPSTVRRPIRPQPRMPSPLIWQRPRARRPTGHRASFTASPRTAASRPTTP